MDEKKPLKPKLKRFLLPTFLQVLEAISPQFVNVMDTYTNQQDVPHMLQQFPHGLALMVGPTSSTLPGLVCLRDHVNAPCEVAKLMDTVLSHPHGFLKAVSGGGQRASGHAGRDTRGTGPMVTSIFQPWCGVMAHGTDDGGRISVGARIYGALSELAGEDFFF
jgi:hypothetical protein